MSDPTAALLQTGAASQRAHFADVSLPEPATRLRLQAGRWRVGASFVIYERPMLVDPDFHNVVAASASVDGRELDGAEWSGFEIDISGPLTLTLALRVVADDEL